MKNFDSVQGTGYRYVTQGELNTINSNGGNIPAGNKYCSLSSFNSGAAAKDGLQLPFQATDYVARVDFNIASVKNNIRLAFDSNEGNTQLFEPLTRAFPNLGSGGATQFIVDGAATPVTVHPF